MVEIQRNLCRFPYVDSAVFQPSKIKLGQDIVILRYKVSLAILSTLGKITCEQKWLMTMWTFLHPCLLHPFSTPWPPDRPGIVLTKYLAGRGVKNLDSLIF